MINIYIHHQIYSFYHFMYQKLKDCNIANLKVINMNYKLDIID